MNRTRVILAALGAIAVLGGAAASSASAAQWFITGTPLAANKTAAVASTAAVDGATTFSSPAVSAKVSCGENLALFEPVLQSEGLYLLEEHVWTGCSVVGPAVCSLGSSQIGTKPLVGTVKTSTGTQDRVTFKPKTGKLIAVLIFEGATCPLAGEQPINGSFTQKLPTGQTEAVIQPFEGLGSVENSSLFLGPKLNSISPEKWQGISQTGLRPEMVSFH